MIYYWIQAQAIYDLGGWICLYGYNTVFPIDGNTPMTEEALRQSFEEELAIKNGKTYSGLKDFCYQEVDENFVVDEPE